MFLDPKDVVNYGTTTTYKYLFCVTIKKAVIIDLYLKVDTTGQVQTIAGLEELAYYSG